MKIYRVQIWAIFHVQHCPNQLQFIYGEATLFGCLHNEIKKVATHELYTFMVATFSPLFYPYPFGGLYLSFDKFHQCPVFLFYSLWWSVPLFRQISSVLRFYINLSGGPYLSFAKFLQCSVFILTFLVVRTSLSLDFISAPCSY